MASVCYRGDSGVAAWQWRRRKAAAAACRHIGIGSIAGAENIAEKGRIAKSGSERRCWHVAISGGIRRANGIAEAAAALRWALLINAASGRKMTRRRWRQHVMT